MPATTTTELVVALAVTVLDELAIEARAHLGSSRCRPPLHIILDAGHLTAVLEGIPHVEILQARVIIGYRSQLKVLLFSQVTHVTP